MRPSWAPDARRLSSWAAAQRHVYVIDGRVHPFDSSKVRAELEEAVRAEVFKRRGPDENDDLTLTQVTSLGPVGCCRGMIRDHPLITP
jgi:hypothetical protein